MDLALLGSTLAERGERPYRARASVSVALCEAPDDAVVDPRPPVVERPRDARLGHLARHWREGDLDPPVVELGDSD
jgi:hypothetical protein